MTARRESNPRDASWLEALPIGVGVFDPQGTLASANTRFFALLGHADQAAITSLATLSAHVAANAVPADRSPDAGLAPGQCGSAATRWRRSDGPVIDLAAIPLPDGGRMVTLTDVTAAARDGEEAIGKAEALQSILEAIPHGVCVYGADRRVTMFNRTYTQVMDGAPLMVGDLMEDVIRRRAAAGEFGPGAPEAIVTRQMAFDIRRPQTRRRRRPNGMMIDIRTAPLPDGGHISVVTDITALTEAEAEVTRRAEEMAAMLGSIRHGILLWGADRRLLASNRIAADLLGHPPGLLTPGRTQDELLDEMERRGDLGAGAAGQEAIRSLRGREPGASPLRQVVTRTGRALEIRSDPTQGGGRVTTFSDVTEARRAEQEARRARDAAEAANQAKSRFLATMSHELRTPLNAVIGFSDAMLREADNPSPARVAEFARQINESGRNLLGLINIVLDVASIESGRFELAADRVDVGRLIRSAIRHTDVAAQAAEITLIPELPAKLPAMRGDERRLSQVLDHLLSNAVKFTAAGGAITVGAKRRRDGELLIFVRDTGMGIAPENLERVFEPFTQIDGTLSRRFQGAGLGLYVSRALVKGHGGQLTLQSRPGEGTTAEIRLPASILLSSGQR